MNKKVNYMDNFKTSEEYIRHQINANRGTQNVIRKSDLAKIARLYDIDVNENKMTKDDIYLMLRDKISVKTLANECIHLGVNSFAFQQKFDITHDEVKRMARLGFIEITGSERFRAYGKYRYADLYSVFDYFRLTQDEVKQWLSANPKGTRSKAT